MLRKIDSFWNYSAKDIMAMGYKDIKKEILAAAAPANIEEVAVTLTKRREAADSPAEQLACNRILSALIEGPDVLEF